MPKAAAASGCALTHRKAAAELRPVDHPRRRRSSARPPAASTGYSASAVVNVERAEASAWRPASPPDRPDDPLLREEEAVDGDAGGERHQRDLQAPGADGGDADHRAGQQPDGDADRQQQDRRDAVVGAQLGDDERRAARRAWRGRGTARRPSSPAGAARWPRRTRSAPARACRRSPRPAASAASTSATAAAVHPARLGRHGLRCGVGCVDGGGRRRTDAPRGARGRRG